MKNLCPCLVGVRCGPKLSEKLHTDHCKSSGKLLEPLSVKNEKYSIVEGCPELKEIQGLKDSKKLPKLSKGTLPLPEKLSNPTISKVPKESSELPCIHPWIPITSIRHAVIWRQ